MLSGVEFECVICGGVFVPKHSRQKVCYEDVCRKKRHSLATAKSRERKKLGITYPRMRRCIHCGNEFEARVAVEKLCSDMCRYNRSLVRQARVQKAYRERLRLKARDEK